MAVAPVPPPPVNEIVGAVVYPVPALVIVNPVTIPSFTIAVAAPPVPEPVVTTVGELVYPEPVDTVTAVTAPPEIVA